MKNKLVKRRQVREKAVQTLFQLIEAPEYLTVEVATAFALEAGNDPEAGFDEVGDAYLYEIVNGVLEHQEAIDREIGSFLSDWTIDRLAKIDLVVLRVAFYELLYVDRELVPAKVAVNEAIDLSKLFSDEKSRRFVSGVLLEYLNQHQEA
ncbi:transcription antitermination factor NusB [Tuanshanicoccus yangjingiae]|uniref:transcription antitermination factor NusB n=1 Tax=Aerococcaceae bacterium zg-252 TaxID=2796928 RepID=UPI0040628753